MTAVPQLPAEALYAEGMSKSFGGLKVFHDVSFTLQPGGLWG